MDFMVSFMKGPPPKYIVDQQFNLSYHMNMTWKDTQDMIPYEREIIFNRLHEQIEAERKKYEESLKD